MDPTDAKTIPAPASELSRLRSLLREQKFSEALAAGQSLLEEFPDHRDGLLFVAVAQRCLGGVPDALNTLAKLERKYPRFSRLYEERGHCFVFLKRAPQAIDAFLAAVNLNHALPSSWSMLEGLYRMGKHGDKAADAADQLAILRNLPQQVVTATGLFADGDMDAAESMIRAFLLQHGNHVEAMRLLARIGMARMVFDDAQLLLAAVLQLAPTYRAARHEYAGVLLELHHYAQARRELDGLLKEDPGNRSFNMLYAACLAGLGEHERAIAIYRGLLEGGTDDADVYLSIGHAQKTLGRQQEAIEAYRMAAACRPHFGDAYWSLANLKTYRFAAEEMSRLRAAEASPEIAVVDRFHLCFALGKALEDEGDFEKSMHYYQLGNALKRAQSNYRSGIVESNTRQQMAVCTAAFFDSRRGAGARDPDPIFIVGLPRSGSTLLEQILASHSLVEGTQELANIQQIVYKLRGRDPDPTDPRYPAIFNQMSDDDFRQLGEQYLAETRAHRTGRPFFIDKMPNNFRHLGLIHLMLPNARIIDARREPMACCFSNLKQLFANGQEFTYSVEDIARYYRTYLELMGHWNRVLPGRVLRILHEDVVEDLEGNVRRLLEFCSLPFEPACVAFHKTARSVRTASSEQVRQPLYREGLDQWKHFEPWLEPLRNALGDALVRYRDE